MNANVKPKTIFTGDNLPIMRGMNRESVDLIYLDPPFNSNVDYAAPIGSEAAGAEFKDAWSLNDVDIAWLDLIETKYPALNRVIHAAMSNSDKSYLIYMTVRLLEMPRILKMTGSIYLHCDPTMSHYLKLVMDAIFGKENYHSEIIWNRQSHHNDKLYGATHDTIFYYTFGSTDIRDEVRLPLTEKREKEFKHRDHRFHEHGFFAKDPVTASGPSAGESGQPWRDVDPGHQHWRAPKIGSTGTYAEYIQEHFISNYGDIEGVHAHLNALDDHDLIYWTSGGKPRIKRYRKGNPGPPPQNIWNDIDRVRGKKAKKYHTQKPVALLDRIIKASLNEDGIIFDPFCGCATTCVAADRLQRRWIGIDISKKAAELVVKRIKKDQGLFDDIIHRSDIPKRTDLGDIPPYNAPENKTQLYGEQGGDCNGCRTHFLKQNLEIDHIIARSVGGTDHIENLQLLCGNCNRIKGNRGQEYLLSRLNVS